ncbi:MAG: metal ABC transporter ATP-binding protein [Acidiferrobacterales bacterium]|nr:metal ABC transporter ATP-binding protein [Acidiferrobacterales bacterium]
MQGPSISFKNVSLNLNNTQILDNVSFDVAAGSIHCIIGANGGGKTSLVRSMLKQMPHTGDITINWQENRNVGYVPQSLDFDKTMPVTVLDFMTMACQSRPVFLGLSNKVRPQLEQVLEQFGMADKLNHKLGSLSGGERQRTLFAQAFVPKPSLLVLDEPMTGLDVEGAELFLKVLQDFIAEGGTVIWVNHDIRQVSELADKVTYIDGSVKFDGAPQEVLVSGAAEKLFPTLSFVQSEAVTDKSEANL